MIYFGLLVGTFLKYIWVKVALKTKVVILSLGFAKSRLFLLTSLFSQDVDKELPWDCLLVTQLPKCRLGSTFKWRRVFKRCKSLMSHFYHFIIFLWNSCIFFWPKFANNAHPKEYSRLIHYPISITIISIMNGFQEIISGWMTSSSFLSLAIRAIPSHAPVRK